MHTSITNLKTTQKLTNKHGIPLVSRSQTTIQKKKVVWLRETSIP